MIPNDYWLKSWRIWNANAIEIVDFMVIFHRFFVNVYQRVTPTDFHSIIFQRGRLNHQPEWLVTQVTSRLQKPIIIGDFLQSWPYGDFFFFFRNPRVTTWWLIPLSKWVITPVINGISRVNPLITGVITHLLSGMSHQVVFFGSRGPCFTGPRGSPAEVLSACSSPSTRGSCPMSTWVAPPSCGCWRRRAPWRRPLGCSSCAPSRWCPGHLGEASPWGSLRIGPWFFVAYPMYKWITGWWFGTFFVTLYWECHHPNWLSKIFQRGKYTTNQIKYF